MRKLFRFKYEPCKGDCYAWCDHLPQELNKMTDEERQTTVALMVEAHNRLCDNPEYSFGIDQDNVTKMFVAHFRSPASTETFLSPDFGSSVRSVCQLVMATDIPQITGACSYGDNGAEDLGAEILRACVDIVYREAHHDNCPCQKMA